MTAQRHVIVVGAGIIGASIAWHLVRAGARVTLIGRQPGGVATPNSFAWINASWGNPEPYFRLRTRSMAEWKQLAATVPGLAITAHGGLCFDLPPAELEAYAAEHGVWGYGVERLDRQAIAAIEPGLAIAPDVALHIAEESAVEPVAATLALIADARARGADIRDHTDVLALLRNGDRVTGIATADGQVPADHVVVAAGTATDALAATIGLQVPLEAPPGLLVHSKPVARLLNGLVIAPELHMRQTAAGRIVAGSDFAGADPGADERQVADALFAKVRAGLHGGDALEMEFYTVGHRPTPADGYPIVGAVEECPGLTLAVMHSGITLAPAIGLLLTSEIMTGEPEALLAPYRLSRFR